jgi:hypothetical protein
MCPLRVICCKNNKVLVDTESCQEGSAVKRASAFVESDDVPPGLGPLWLLKYATANPPSLVLQHVLYAA